MTAKRPKKKAYSRTRTVKAHARALLGPPPAQRALPAARPAPGRKQKHRPTLDHLLTDE